MSSEFNRFDLVIEAGHHRRENCPVELRIPVERIGEEIVAWIAKGASLSFFIADDKAGVTIPCQAELSEGDKPEVVIRFVIDYLLAGERRKVSLRWQPGEDLTHGGSGVELVSGEFEEQIYIDGDYFSSYVYDPQYAKPFLGPIVGPYGDWVTRLDHTIKEHPHHRSVWVAIGDVNGVDTWNEPQGKFGRQLHQRFTSRVSGPVYCRLASENLWTTFDREPLVDESREIVIYRTPKTGRIVDVSIRFTANHGKVVFGRTKEAGPLGIRVAESMKVKNGGRIENAIGSISEAETWGKRAHWCDYSGDVEGHRLGIAAFDSPSNRDYPTFWHVRDYGLMAPNNFYFAGPITLEPGQSIDYRYRIYFHLGDAAEGDVAAKYHDYINAPRVKEVVE